jgi:hypothetical protein
VRANEKARRQATKLKIRQQERERYWKDPDKARRKAAQYRAENYDEVMRRNRERLKDERENLKPRYVAKVLGTKPGEVPPPLLALAVPPHPPPPPAPSCKGPPLLRVISLGRRPSFLLLSQGHHALLFI